MAHHEAGHTIIHLQTQLMPPLYKVSIVPRGQVKRLSVAVVLDDQRTTTQDASGTPKVTAKPAC